MMSGRQGTTAVLAVSGVLGLAACGGGGGGGGSSSQTTQSSTSTTTTTQTTTTQTPQQFAQQVRMVCRQNTLNVGQTVSQLQGLATGGGSTQQRAKKASQAIGQLGNRAGNLRDRLANLQPPQQDSRAYHRFLRSLSRLNTLTGRAATDLRKGNVAAVQSELTNLPQVAQQLQSSARRVPALQACLTSAVGGTGTSTSTTG